MRSSTAFVFTAVLLLITFVLIGLGGAATAKRAAESEAIEIRVSDYVYAKKEADENGPNGRPVEHCNAMGQCADSPAESIPAAEHGERNHPSYLEQVEAFQASALATAARNMKEIEERVDIVLQQLKTVVAQIVRTTNNACEAVRAKYQVVYQECAVLYGVYLADIVEWLAAIYRDVAAVVMEGYAVVSAWVAVAVERGLVFWHTHEEVRIVTHHLSAVLLLVGFGAAFFALYALVSTVPDSLVALLSSLDDVTRAQLKIAAVLAFALAFYHLRSLWSFWGGVGVVGFFYYWSGHVVADVPSPLHQRPRSLSGHAPLLRKSKTL